MKCFTALWVACLVLPSTIALPAADRIALFGDALAGSEKFKSELARAGFEVATLNANQLEQVDRSGVAVLVVGPDASCPPAARPAIARFLESRGNVFVIGPAAFDYTPRPVRGVAVVDLRNPAAYTVAQPKLRGAGEGSTVEPVRVTEMRTPQDRPALQFATHVRGMNETWLQFPVAAANARRTVLTFRAKGDAYADLLAIEAVDKRGGRWRTFVPMAPRWQAYAISLADFLPLGWKKTAEIPPQVDPAELASLALGIDAATVWREKPMAFSLAEIGLAENETGEFTPAARLAALTLPFHEREMAVPPWLFQPFEGTREVSPPLTGVSVAWRCPPPLVSHPGVQMGTDTKAAYDTKSAREQRRIELLRNSAGEVVSELRLLAGGAREGAAVGLFGVTPRDFVQTAALREILVSAAVDAVRPKIAAVSCNTTVETASGPARPALTVHIRNPLPRALDGRVRVTVGGGALQGDASVRLTASATTIATVVLNEVPADFAFREFDWSVTLETESGRDEFRDHVDVERALLHALGHLAATQRQFPDGRISHHYFGDAYGVRALFGYLDLVQREPARLERNRDLWAANDPATLRAAGLRFVDMLLARQTAQGELPMGYGEQAPVYNVADGGQITLSLGQIAPRLDPARREACWQACRKFADWAESFYIDDALARKLAAAQPAKATQARAGHYGLGSSRGVRNPYGPSWVLPDILGVQVLLTYVDARPEYRRIADRNIRAYLDAGYAAAGYFHAEALTWAWRDATDVQLRRQIAERLRQTFVPPLVEGKPFDMYELGARGSLRALPMIYCRRWIEDSAGLRAALLKYVWAFASESSERSMRRLAEAHPKPQHGEAIAASKFASFSAIWAMELLEPDATFLRWPGFPRGP